MKPLLVSSGEPAGVGPDLCLQLTGLPFPLVVMADPELLAERAQQLKLPVRIKEYTAGDALRPESNTLSVYPLRLPEACVPGQLAVGNAPYVHDMLQTAAELCLRGQFSALVTAPVHKAIINDAGIPFSGHTEFLAQHCATQQVVMMLASKQMRVALATTHVPLRCVASTLDRQKLQKTIQILHQALQRDFGIAEPVIYLAGLNPHAGENGYLGREEIDLIAPVATECRNAGIHVVGPMSADTMFSRDNNRKCDAYLAMYHDQGLAVIKYASFGEAANITLGLPIVRTSVDHGTALERAGKQGQVDAGSMRYAIDCAWQMVKRRQDAQTHH
ncbi:MAG: 4-hydroxythreonine-4-phosphate dehydrogenase PdxA [Legionellaceae bacterium]|nr:4-hydroxythreonine-4-phosphate dehydrogenase PdxA [Legionellaceae bacterium]